MRILVVEDDPLLRDGLVDLLKGAGHVVDMVSDGLTATKRGLDPELDLVLLDVMLPKLDGIEVCHRLRKARPDLPILMLTAKGAEDDKVRGLKVGADDYVTKPFGSRELLARIAALGRRAKSAPTEPEIIEIDGCRFDLGHCEARRFRDDSMARVRRNADAAAHDDAVHERHDGLRVGRNARVEPVLIRPEGLHPAVPGASVLANPRDVTSGAESA